MLPCVSINIEIHLSRIFITGKVALNISLFSFCQLQFISVILDGKVKSRKPRIIRNGNIQCNFVARLNFFLYSLNGDRSRTAVISASCHSRGERHCEHHHYGNNHR